MMCINWPKTIWVGFVLMFAFIHAGIVAVGVYYFELYPAVMGMVGFSICGVIIWWMIRDE